MSEITGAVHHVNFSVTDIERSQKWYEQLLGLNLVATMQDEGGAWSKVIMRHPGGLMLGLTQHRDNDGAPFSEFRCGVDHLAFAVTDEDALASWAARLDELAIKHSPIKQSALGHVITFRDPDNMQLELYASRS